MRSIAATRHELYAVGTDHKVYRQAIARMRPLTRWELASEGLAVSAIAIRGDVVYGVMHGNEIRSQSLQSMGDCRNWSLAFGSGSGAAAAIAVVPAQVAS